MMPQMPYQHQHNYCPCCGRPNTQPPFTSGPTVFWSTNTRPNRPSWLDDMMREFNKEEEEGEE